MNLNEAKQIIDDYLNHSIKYEIGVLGKDEQYFACGVSLGEIQKAHEKLRKEEIL